MTRTFNDYICTENLIVMNLFHEKKGRFEAIGEVISGQMMGWVTNDMYA